MSHNFEGKSPIVEQVRNFGQQDMVGGKSLYDVSTPTVIWRNLLAGFSRAAGGFIFYLLVFAILGLIAAQTIWPPLKQALQTLEQTSNQLQRTSRALDNLNQPTVSLDSSILPDWLVK